MRAFKTGAAETSNRKSCCSTSSSTEAGPAKGRERASDAVSRLRPVARSRSQRVPTDASAHVPPSLRGTAELDLDIEELIRDRGELPTIERYRDRIDPVLQRDMAERVVERALALAGRHAAELARRWKARHARWTDVIDACLAAVTLDEPASAGESIGACVGASAADGHGRYQIVERLGSGAGGRTYEAVDRSMGARGADARVALKAIPSIGRDLDGLLAEAALARRVKSESVARVLDAGVLSPEHARILCEADSAIFLVHELIDGMPLHVWRAACPRPSARQLDRILGSIRDAVEACHRDGVAHGDLSPANVLITPDERAVLVDFGLGGPTSAAGAPEPASFDLLRYRELEAWLRPGRTDLRGWMHRRHAPVLIAAALIAVGSAAWLLQSTPQHGANADLSAGDRPALAAGPGIESRSWEWMMSVLRDGISASYDRERLRAEADASRALAEEQRRNGAQRADVELLAAVAGLASGDRAGATQHANRSIAASDAQGDGAKTPETDIARLVANLARFFAPGGEDAPPGYAESLELHARRIGAPGLLRLPALEERLAANKSAEEPRRYRSEGGGKVFDAHSGMTIDIPGYEK